MTKKSFTRLDNVEETEKEQPCRDFLAIQWLGLTFMPSVSVGEDYHAVAKSNKPPTNSQKWIGRRQPGVDWK